MTDDRRTTCRRFSRRLALDGDPLGKGEIIAGPAVEPHMVLVLPGNDPEAIVLDLVQPEPASRWLGHSV
jgi:hypothetical protein